MTEPKQIRDIDKLHWKVRRILKKLIANCKEIGLDIVIIETVRSDERQAYLYKLGREIDIENGIVTNVKIPTFHNERVGLAFDIAPLVNGKIPWNGYTNLWNLMGQEGKKLGLTWGGDWKKIVDKPHFQLDEGLKSSDITNGKRPSWFYDEEVSEWAEEYREKLMGLGITDGTSPKNTVTREQEWTMIGRAFNILENRILELEEKIENKK